MGEMPTIRRVLYALAALTLLYASIFVGIENPTVFRTLAVVCGFFLVFPTDQSLRLFHVVTNRRPSPKEFLFSAALDPAEDHFEPDDYTLIGVITEVRKLNPTDPD